MSHPVKGVDHCFVLVNDLDEAAARYQALGFTLSPRGLHSEAKGSANYTIMFPEDYLELLGLLRATELNAPRRKMLEEMGQGLHAVACRIDDAKAAEEALGALGIGAHGYSEFERPVPLPDGGTGRAAFATTMFREEERPFGMVFMCQHKTRETVWLPELLDHPNTACGLGAILAMSDDPEKDAAGFARLYADGHAAKDGSAWRVETGVNSAPILLMSEADMAMIYPGFDLSRTAKGAFTALRVKVTDIDAAGACLEAAGVPSVKTETGLAAGPEFGSGAIVEFVCN